MKRILLTIIFVVAVIFAYAEGHMTFKGVDINGNIESFVAKLEEQGFVKQSIKKDHAIMTGFFTAEDVILYIHATPISNTVYGVSVVYKPADSWPNQETHYRNLRMSLARKYGDPIAEIWDVDDFLPEQKLKEGYSTAKTEYGDANGGVTISIESTVHVGVSTRIFYWDKENQTKNQEEIESDL